MKKLFAVTLVMLGLAGLMLMGCSKDGVTSPGTDPNDQLYGSAQNDEQFLKLYAENDEFFTSDDIAMNDGTTPETIDEDQEDQVDGVMTPIRPLRWARFIRSFSRNVRIDSVTNDLMAYVTITKTWTGELLIAATYNVTSRTPDTIIAKNFQEQARKRIIFRRVKHD